MYSVAGKLLVQLITFLVRKFESIVFKNKIEVRYLYVKTVVVGIVFLLVLIMTGSCVTTSPNMENLDVTSSIYFWFVTWSTIGYGDITFERDQHLRSPHLMIIAVFNLLFGLGMYVAIIEALSTSMVKDNDEESNSMGANTFIMDGEGNVNEDHQDSSNSLSNSTTHLSDQQQVRIQEALRKYQQIKDQCPDSFRPQTPVVFSRDAKNRRLSAFIVSGSGDGDGLGKSAPSTSLHTKMMLMKNKQESGSGSAGLGQSAPSTSLHKKMMLVKNKRESGSGDYGEDVVRPFSSTLSLAKHNEGFEHATTDV